ncbi:MAG: H-NS histone family protein [Rhodobacteraceae bacterium]|nr:H-NS histone family protein [Paracoccaceae bacterium]
MTIDLNSMPRKDLEKLRADVDKAILLAKSRELKEARKAAEQAVAEFGFSLADVTEVAAGAAKSKLRAAVSVPRYRHPENPELTWTGKGRKPEWFKSALASGVQPEEMEI